MYKIHPQFHWFKICTLFLARVSLKPIRTEIKSHSLPPSVQILLVIFAGNLDMPLSMYIYHVMWCSEIHFPLYCINISLFDWIWRYYDVVSIVHNKLCVNVLKSCQMELLQFYNLFIISLKNHMWNGLFHFWRVRKSCVKKIKEFHFLWVFPFISVFIKYESESTGIM